MATPTQAAETTGIVTCANGYRFYWMRSGDSDEVSGFLEDNNGRAVKGTSGWYRTNDPQAAARVAIQRVSI